MLPKFTSIAITPLRYITQININKKDKCLVLWEMYWILTFSTNNIQVFHLCINRSHCDRLFNCFNGFIVYCESPWNIIINWYKYWSITIFTQTTKTNECEANFLGKRARRFVQNMPIYFSWYSKLREIKFNVNGMYLSKKKNGCIVIWILTRFGFVWFNFLLFLPHA